MIRSGTLRSGALAVAAVALVAATAASRAGPRPALHLVHMTSRSAGPRFEPALTTARAGDTVRFVNVRGGPHNVQFFGDSIAEGSREILDSAIGDARIGPLAGRLLWDTEEVYELVVPVLAPGRYPFVCAPHYSGNMTGALIVAP